MLGDVQGCPPAPLSRMHSPQTLTPPLKNKDFDLWIEAGQIEKHYWRDLWNYRELLFMLAWRDVAVRYKQTIAGAAWALLQPFLSMLIMTVIFSRVAGLPSVGSAPYAIMVFAGLLPWQFVSNALANAGQSVVINASMISKVYFPRVIVPAASVFVSVVDFLISFFILIVLMIWFRFVPTARILTLPVFAILAVVVAMGPGLLITALTVRFRDFRFITPFIVQFGMYASPVAYSSEVVRQKLGETGFLLYCLNPVVGVIDGFRWAILGDYARISVIGTCISLTVALLLLIIGLVYFRKTERSFADVI
jgi:lipopolysaccharide transport system permease protein